MSARTALETKLSLYAHVPGAIVDTASRLYHTTTEDDKEDRIIVITAVVKTLDVVMDMEAPRAQLLGNADLNRDVLKMVAKLLKRTPTSTAPGHSFQPQRKAQALESAFGSSLGDKRPGPQLEGEQLKSMRSEPV